MSCASAEAWFFCAATRVAAVLAAFAVASSNCWREKAALAARPWLRLSAMTAFEALAWATPTWALARAASASTTARCALACARLPAAFA
jgi:hypothetical protein